MVPLLPLDFLAPFHALEDALEELLIWIHSTTGLTWAWSIIAMTALVRIVILPVTVKQTRSMLAMQRLQPYVKQVQQKYKDDRQALNQALMQFYRDNQVNPLASCLPILLQIPIFMALFFVLKDFEPPAGTSDNLSFLFGFVDSILVDINDAGFAGWALLIFYAASQVFSSAVMVTSPDPRQKYMMMVLPLLFLPFIWNFPIGVMLYWITTNLWTLGQYKVVVALTNVESKDVVMPVGPDGKQKVLKAKKKPDDGKGSGGSAGTPARTPSGPRSGAPTRKNKRRR
jgi:YidC/Oxa1 family membrane protein insertase